ncbi:MAG: elongation factor G [bacterium]
MKEYPLDKIRNIAIIAHSGAGKTSLAEAILFDSKQTTRLGKPEEGSTVMDFDPEEIRRKISISSSLGFCEWKNHKINIIDTPGDVNFFADTQSCLKVVESAILIVSAISGVKVQTEAAWNLCKQENIPCLIFINKMDRERANFKNALEQLNKVFQATFVTLQMPIGAEENFQGVIDLLKMKAYLFENTTGAYTETDIPQELLTEAQKYREKMMENISELDDALIEKFLDKGELTNEELESGLIKGVKTGKLVPVLCGSAAKNKGVQPLLDLITKAAPSPLDRLPITIKGKDGEDIIINPDPSQPFSAFVFKTIADPHTGRISIFRVFSGTLKSDSSIYNPNKDSKERVGHIYNLIGKTQKTVSEVKAGDLAAVPKLKDTLTNDSLCAEGRHIIFDKVRYSEPVLSFSIEPKTKGDEEKVSTSLHRLTEEDPTLNVHRDNQTHELILAGMGQTHLDVTLSKLKNKFGVEVDVKTPKIPYKETIKRNSKAQGKYKKQSGGKGQYGDAWLEIAPLPKGEGFKFENKIVGGAIPRQYIPAIEKGVHETMAGGVVAGYPVVDIKVSVYDGSYHDVDSSEMAFKIAASMGFKKAVAEADPVLLEPIMNVYINVPTDCMGDVIGDLNSKRGKVLGVDAKIHAEEIKAQVPLAEMLKYTTGLTSITGGRGSFHMEFSHYDELPGHLAEKVIAEYKKEEVHG